MIGTIAPQLSVLSADQARLWPRLKPGAALGFVLYGGTGVSLHLGHRPAADFHFLRARRLDKDALRNAFAFLDKAAVVHDADDMLAVQVSGRGRNALKVAFQGGLTCGRVGDPLLTQDGVLEVASLDDLMAHRVKAVLDGAEKKDFEDIAAMIRAGCSLSRGLASAQALFGKTFQAAAALKALVSPGAVATLSRADRGTVVSAARVVGILPAVKLRSRSLALPLRAGDEGRGSRAE
jgi:hypothetical protein